MFKANTSNSDQLKQPEQDFTANCICSWSIDVTEKQTTNLLDVNLVLRRIQKNFAEQVVLTDGASPIILIKFPYE